MRLRRLAAGLGAGALLLAILAGIPAVLVPAGHGLLPHRVPTLSHLTDLLLRRDDSGRLFAQALLALGWLAWASFALSTVAEAAGRARRRRTIRLPGLSLPQRWVAALVATVALSFAVPGSAAVASPLTAHPPVAAATATATAPAVSGDVAVAAHVYTVRHGDYLGAIAERFEGHFEDYHDLAAANHIDDPHLIHPGQRIVLPADARDHGRQPHAAGSVTTQSHDPAPTATATGSTMGLTAGSTTPTPGSTHTATTQDPAPIAAGPVVGDRSGDLAGVLLDGLGTLAAAIGAVELVRRRRHSLQRRLVPAQSPPRPEGLRPGTPWPAEPRLMPAPNERDVVRLDAALRYLADRVAAWPIERLPQITGALLDRGAITLMMAGPAGAPPDPYTMDDNGWWRLDAAIEVPGVPSDVLAPLPSLAMVAGQGGRHLLLDLEFLRALSIGGDPGAVRDLLRYVVLDLCHNIWADDLRITLTGFGPAEADLLRSADPRRVRHVETVTEAIDWYGRHLGPAGPEGPADVPNEVLIIADPGSRDVLLISAMEARLHAAAGTGVSMLVASEIQRCGYHMSVDAAGVLDVGWLGAALPAATIPEGMLGDVVAYLATQRASGAVTRIDVARVRSREARSGTSGRPVPVAGQHRRAKSDPVPAWATMGEELMRPRHARTAWS